MALGQITTFTNQTTNIETFLNNKALALVSPKTSPGVSGFVFDIPQREEITLSSDITDNYTENNSFIQDHRVIKPAKVNLSGLIGELTVKQNLADIILQTIQSSLTTISAYHGTFTDGVDQIIQQTLSTSVTAASRLSQIANRIKNIVEGFDGEGQYRNLQQRAFSNIEALFLSKTLLTVQTPWKYYDNMLIETLTFSQGEESEQISNVTITLKEIRFAEIGVTTYKDDLEANRNELQSKENNDTGQIKGNRNSFLFDGTTALTGGF